MMTAEYDEAKDETLWGLVCNDDRAAFEAVVRRHQTLVAGVAYNICGDLAASEDVAQEAFLAAWRQRDSLQDPTRLRPWLCGIARNLASNAMRRSTSRTVTTSLDEISHIPDPTPEPSAETLRREEEALIWSTLEAIPNTYREPLILFYRQHHSVADVAASLELSEDAVKQRLARGRSMLRDRLADLVEDGLQRSRPGRTFTTRVMTGIAVAGMGTKSAAAATTATSMIQATATAGAAAGLLGAFGGLFGGWFGSWISAQAAPSLTERDLRLRSGRRLFAGSLVFLLVLLTLTWRLSGTNAYLPSWLAAMVVFQAWVGLEAWRLVRASRALAQTKIAPSDANRNAVRRGIAFVARRTRGRVYRSSHRFLGLPLIDVQVADPPHFDPDGILTQPAEPKRSAKGWIAIGDEARGILLAIGANAYGGVAIGARSIGLASFGGVAVGLVSFGGLAIGSVAIAGAAFGGVAFGGLAVGVDSFGGLAVGSRLAVGGAAISWNTALGGASLGRTPVAQHDGVRWLAGGDSGVPALDGTIGRTARWFLMRGSVVGLGLAAVCLLLEGLRGYAMYGRRSTILGASLVLLCISTLGCSGPAASTSIPERFQLENGLTVLVRPVAETTETAILVLYDVGGDHDPEGSSGLAHLMEHVYITSAVEGVPARSAQEFFERYPAGCNAQTGDRYTVFATVVPEAGLDAELREAALRMGSLAITQADLDRERPRLLQEIAAMFDGPPSLSAVNRARELVRPTPHGGRRGGSPEQITALGLDDVVAHWTRHYKPRNAILAISGAVDAEQVRAMVKRYFAPLPQGQAPPVPGEPGPAMLGGPAVGFRAPGVTTAAVAVASPLPDEPRYAVYALLAARLMKAVQTDSKSVQLYMPLLDDPAAVVVSTSAQSGESPEVALKRLDGWLDSVLAMDLTSHEVDEAFTSLGFVLGLSELPDQALAANLYGVAFTMGRREQLGIDPFALKTTMQATTTEHFHQAGTEAFGGARRGRVFARSSWEPTPR